MLADSDAAGRSAPTYLVTATAAMQAPPERVYGIIADYRAGHPRILPEPYFSNLRVDEGGVGAGTRFRFDVRAFGRTQTLESYVTEPVPGRELVERYPETGVVTTFRVEPQADCGSRVTIASAMPRRPGIGGALEKLVMPPFLRRLFRDELSRLARVASQSAGST